MVLEKIVGSIAVSYVANCLPSLSSIWNKFQGIENHIKVCFEKAKVRFFPSREIRDYLPIRYHSFESFGRYLSSLDGDDQEAEQFLSVLEEEFRGDALCSNLLLEWKLQEVNSILESFLSSVQKNQKSFKEISSNLVSVDQNLSRRYHINREETSRLIEWVISDNLTKDYLDRIAVVTGSAGCGKTVVLSDLVKELEKEGVPVIGLKSDYLFDSTETDIDKAVNIGGKTLIGALTESAQRGLSVLVIDQVDALSLSLTMRRKPLAEVQRVIQMAAENPNIKVVFSCREYDFNNERNFDRYATCKRVNVGELSRESIEKALSDLKISTKGLKESDFRFLAIPLNLSLFCRLNDDSKRGTLSLSSHSLYGEFWTFILKDKAIESGMETSRLLDYLAALSDRMVSEQVLAIRKEVMGIIWAKEQDFLLSNGFLLMNSDGTKIQFFHQTLFDYTIARLFIEKNKSIDTAFIGLHQGLFLRGRIKRTLEYQRGVSESDYLNSIRSILGIGQPHDAYRFHLKQLVLSLLGAQEALLPSEISLMKHSILTDNKLRSVFIQSAYAKEPIELVVDFMMGNGGLSAFPIDDVQRIYYLLQTIFSKDNKWVIDILNRIRISSLEGEYKSTCIRSINYYPIDSSVDIVQLLPIVNQLDDCLSVFPFDVFYQKVASFTPEIASSRVSQFVDENLRICKAENPDRIWDFDIPYEVKEIINTIQKDNPRFFLQFGIRLLNLLLAFSALDEGGENNDIKASVFYLLYNRENDPTRFSDELLDELLNVVEKAVDESWDTIRTILKDQSCTNFAANHIIAIVGWLRNAEEYKNDAKEYLVNNLLREDHSSVLNYYQIRLFGAVFMLLDQEGQKELIDVTMRVSPSWEKVVIKDRLSDQYSNTSIGKTRALYLATIPSQYLKKYFENAWHVLQEAKRKGFNLNTDSPNKVQFMSGWTTFSDEEFDSMRSSDYVRIAEKYGADNSIDFSEPTMHGNAWAMRGRAEKDPERFYQIYLELIHNGSANLYYVSTGLSALQEGGLSSDKMEILYEALITAVSSDISLVSPEIVMDISRSLNYYIKYHTEAPKVLMDFVIHVAYEADDSKDDSDERIDHNTGINRVRGCAVEHLVESSFMDSYRESIFMALEKIAQGAAISTRCAALFQMAHLMKYDKERTTCLFLKLTADYNVDILSLPVHSLNPLNYIIDYDFGRLIPYFEQSVKLSKTHRVNVQWLWIATIRNKDGAKELLFKMGDASESGRSAIVKCTSDIYNLKYQTLVEESLIRYLNYDEDGLGRAYDGQFDTFDKWPRESVKSYLDIFFQAPVVKYCSRGMYRYLKKCAYSDAKHALSWLMFVYPRKRENYWEQSELLDILFAAYNRILVFDKSDPDLEEAMNILDSFLFGGNTNMAAHVISVLGNE